MNVKAGVTDLSQKPSDTTVAGPSLLPAPEIL